MKAIDFFSNNFSPRNFLEFHLILQYIYCPPAAWWGNHVSAMITFIPEQSTVYDIPMKLKTSVRFNKGHIVKFVEVWTTSSSLPWNNNTIWHVSNQTTHVHKSPMWKYYGNEWKYNKLQDMSIYSTLKRFQGINNGKQI
jgi:hypothetical protein